MLSFSIFSEIYQKGFMLKTLHVLFSELCALGDYFLLAMPPSKAAAVCSHFLKLYLPGWPNLSPNWFSPLAAFNFTLRWNEKKKVEGKRRVYEKHVFN